MRIPLHSPARRVGLLVACVAAAAVYVGLATTEYLAAHFSRRPNLQALDRAARLQPGNADYRYRVGRYLFLVQHEALSAIPFFKAAVALNPHKARYWFDLAAAYQLLGDGDAQQDSLEHAIRADPKTPDVAWEAANLYLVRGETDKALAEFRTVLESDPSLAPSALQLCWRVRPDVDALLPLQVLGMILKQGVQLALAGIAVGVLGAFALTRVMATLLYQVKPSDPITFVTVPLALVAVAAIASYIPALRATRVSPVKALRME